MSKRKRTFVFAGYWVVSSHGHTERDHTLYHDAEDDPEVIFQEIEDAPSEEYPAGSAYKDNIRTVVALWSDRAAHFVLDPESVVKLHRAGALIEWLPEDQIETDPHKPDIEYYQEAPT
jgi:hypothetical protein